MKALLRHGADPAASDESGLTALDYARRKLTAINSRPRRPRRTSPSLDENGQLRLSAEEQAELDKTRAELGEDARDFMRVYWRERLRAARIQRHRKRIRPWSPPHAGRAAWLS